MSLLAARSLNEFMESSLACLFSNEHLSEDVGCREREFNERKKDEQRDRSITFHFTDDKIKIRTLIETQVFWLY